MLSIFFHSLFFKSNFLIDSFLSTFIFHVTSCHNLKNTALNFHYSNFNPVEFRDNNFLSCGWFRVVCQYFSLNCKGGGGGGVQPKFLGKLGLEIGVYQKTPPIGDLLVKFRGLYTFCAPRDGCAG